MKVQPAAFLRSTLPLALAQLPAVDNERYHSLWIPDHMVSFWPISIWAPEFTDLALTSHSPHRHLDGLAVAAAAAVLTQHIPLATSVVDTVRRHPSLLAQTALTIDHLSKGRFILGLAAAKLKIQCRMVSIFPNRCRGWKSRCKSFACCGNVKARSTSRANSFSCITHVWTPNRLQDAIRRYGWPLAVTPNEYAAKLKTIRVSAERAGRDPLTIVPAIIMPCLIGDEEEIAEIMQAPLIRAYVMQISAEQMRRHGHEHPIGREWQGFQDINPGVMTRDKIVAMLEKVKPEMILSVVPHGTPKQVACELKTFVDAGMRVPKIMHNGGMAGAKYAARSAAKVRETEDELLRLVS